MIFYFIKPIISKLIQYIFLQEISPGFVNTEIGGDYITAPEVRTLIERGEIPMLKSSDISQTVIFMLMTPYEVNITEMIVKPVGEQI